MKIIAVCTALEEPHLGRTIQHLYSQGVDKVIVSCPPDDQTTLAAIDTVERNLRPCLPGPFDQGAEITALAHWAAELGADWIIPFDADEYWCGPADWTIRQALSDLTCDVVVAPMYQYISPDFRHEEPKPLPKMAFRPCEGMLVAWGSHNVEGPDIGIAGRLVVRELQYESYGHFLAKIEKARVLHSQPHMADHQYGSHMWRLCNLTRDQLRAEWEQMMDVPVVYDPIPGSDKWT